MKLFDAIQKADAARKAETKANRGKPDPLATKLAMQDAIEAQKRRDKGRSPVERLAAADLTSTIEKINKDADARQAAEDVKNMGKLGKPFMLQLHADMEKAVEEIRVLWGMKSRSQAIRTLIGMGITTM